MLFPVWLENSRVNTTKADNKTAYMELRLQIDH